MNLFKTSVLNGIAVAIKLVTALGLNKLLAVYVGPAGYAVIGQFQNAIGMITTFASAGINTGVTKYTAEYFDDDERQRSVWRTAVIIVAIGSLFAALGIAIFHRSLALLFLKNEAYGSVFLWFAATLTLFVFNALLLAILNGKKDIRRYVIVNITGSLVSLVVTGFLARVWSLYGALVALATNQSIVFIVTFAMCLKTDWFRLQNLIGNFDRSIARNLAKFVLMALTTAAVGPTSQIIVRNHIATTLGWTTAGHWQAVTKISEMYLLLVTSTLGIYYLPRLSEIRDNRELKQEIIQGYKLILPLAVLGAGTIYLLRDWIVLTLFSPDFSPMKGLFAWQLAGDVVKIGSWLLAYVMLGRTMVRTFIITEVLFTVTWIGMVYYLTDIYGVQGVLMAYFSNYVLYWMVMFILVWRQCR
ncbi:O-antigen translocase [Geotalea uraniireducens]|uniref:Polysaccharide biosynthesis protein n=1 Tax=Geotalea uraniireducens (strain Rf4) TaxID=351605 RepID=A5G6D2_GEOUR|nr:O-antigen translocase [Geotalea uraniireducens]ABQ27350.1 polysaccharide biosynthesis protein [Geotalea uraniireducens Rf4]